jgi:hypothetical protein
MPSVGVDAGQHEGRRSQGAVQRAPRRVRDSQPAAPDRGDDQRDQAHHRADRGLRAPRLAHEAQQPVSRGLQRNGEEDVSRQQPEQYPDQVAMQTHCRVGAESREDTPSRGEEHDDRQHAQRGDAERRPQLGRERALTVPPARAGQQERADQDGEDPAERQEKPHPSSPPVRWCVCRVAIVVAVTVPPPITEGRPRRGGRVRDEFCALLRRPTLGADGETRPDDDHAHQHGRQAQAQKGEPPGERGVPRRARSRSGAHVLACW